MRIQTSPRTALLKSSRLLHLSPVSGHTTTVALSGAQMQLRQGLCAGIVHFALDFTSYLTMPALLLTCSVFCSIQGTAECHLFAICGAACLQQSYVNPISLCKLAWLCFQASAKCRRRRYP